jgi:hypothetical protein
MGVGKVHRNRKNSGVIPERETACNTCRDGLCNASIRSARLEATGCERLTPAESSAAIAAPRSAMFRRQSAHACGCVPARWAATARRAARRADRANHREQPQTRSSRSLRDEPVPAPIPNRPSPTQPLAMFREVALRETQGFLCVLCVKSFELSREGKQKRGRAAGGGGFQPLLGHGAKSEQLLQIHGSDDLSTVLSMHSFCRESPPTKIGRE